jgi:hypothetical protein
MNSRRLPSEKLLRRSRAIRRWSCRRLRERVTFDSIQREHIQSVLREASWVIEGSQGAAVRLGLKPGPCVLAEVTVRRSGREHEIVIGNLEEILQLRHQKDEAERREYHGSDGAKCIGVETERGARKRERVRPA